MSDTIAISSEMVDGNTTISFTLNSNNINSYTEINVESENTSNLVLQVDYTATSGNLDSSNQFVNFVDPNDVTQNDFPTFTPPDPQVFSNSNSNVVIVSSTSTGNFITQHTSIYYSSSISGAPTI